MDYRKNYRDVIPYIFFGICTTAVNVMMFWLIVHKLRIGTMIGTVLAWIVAVVFAYSTNRKWVFKSRTERIIEIMTEMSAFFSCRFATGVIDWLMMWILVDIQGFNDIIIKCIANILVILLNYIASKWIIFKEKTANEG